MRDYELTVLLKPTLTDKEIDKITKTLTDLLTKAGGKVVKKTDAAKKALAYKIADFREGFYAYMELNLKPEDIKEIERTLKLQENIVRYLLIVKD